MIRDGSAIRHSDFVIRHCGKAAQLSQLPMSSALSAMPSGPAE
jgi:hypothetical protein